MIRIAALILFLQIAGSSWAQQDAQLSLYLRNPSELNPAHTGLNGTLRATVISRTQWTGWEGAPRTQWFSVHAPGYRNRVGFGLSLMNDFSGARGRKSFRMNAAYHLANVTEDIQLSFGIGVGLAAELIDFTTLQVRHENDNVYLNSFRSIRPIAGTGFLLQSSQWFAGLSLPQLLPQLVGPHVDMGLRQRHSYLTAGYVHELNPICFLRASSLMKWTRRAPSMLDVNVDCWFYDVLSVGVMGRVGEGMGIQTSYRLKNGLRIHYAADFPTNGLMTRSFGSHEIGLAWDANRRSGSLQSPRYF
jgi:type IX secretion system PorP/SprF family membrane protein